MLGIEGRRIAVIPNPFILHLDKALVDQFPAGLEYDVDFLFDNLPLRALLFHKRVFELLLIHVAFIALTHVDFAELSRPLVRQFFCRSRFLIRYVHGGPPLYLYLAFANDLACTYIPIAGQEYLGQAALIPTAAGQDMFVNVVGIADFHVFDGVEIFRPAPVDQVQTVAEQIPKGFPGSLVTTHHYRFPGHVPQGLQGPFLRQADDEGLKAGTG